MDLPLPESVSVDGKEISLGEVANLIHLVKKRKLALNQVLNEVREHLKYLARINILREAFCRRDLNQHDLPEIKEFNRLVGAHLELVGNYFTDEHELLSVAREMLIQGLIDEDQFRLAVYPEYQVDFNPHEQRELALFALIRADLVWQALRDVPLGENSHSFDSVATLSLALAQTEYEEEILYEVLAKAAKLDLPSLVSRAHDEWNEDNISPNESESPLTALVSLETGLKSHLGLARIPKDQVFLLGVELEHYLGGLYLLRQKIGQAEAEIRRMLGSRLINQALSLYRQRLSRISGQHWPIFEAKFVPAYRDFAGND